MADHTWTKVGDAVKYRVACPAELDAAGLQPVPPLPPGSDPLPQLVRSACGLLRRRFEEVTRGLASGEGDESPVDSAVLLLPRGEATRVRALCFRATFRHRQTHWTQDAAGSEFLRIVAEFVAREDAVAAVVIGETIAEVPAAKAGEEAYRGLCLTAAGFSAQCEEGRTHVMPVGPTRDVGLPVEGSIAKSPEEWVAGVLYHYFAAQQATQGNLAAPQDEPGDSAAPAPSPSPSALDMAEEQASNKSKGTAAFKAKDFESALKWYSAAVEEAPEDKFALSNRAAAYQMLGQHRLALQDAMRASQADPHWAKGWFRQARALAALRQYDQAAARFLEALYQEIAAVEGERERCSPGEPAAATPGRTAGVGREIRAAVEAALRGASGSSSGRQHLQTCLEEIDAQLEEYSQMCDMRGQPAQPGPQTQALGPDPKGQTDSDSGSDSGCQQLPAGDAGHIGAVGDASGDQKPSMPPTFEAHTSPAQVFEDYTKLKEMLPAGMDADALLKGVGEMFQGKGGAVSDEEMLHHLISLTGEQGVSKLSLG